MKIGVINSNNSLLPFVLHMVKETLDYHQLVVIRVITS